jgi:hypothetical protein
MENVKTTQITTLIGVLTCSLLSGRTPLHAQPTPANAPSTSSPKTSAPAASSLIIVEGGDDKPWNQGVPVATRQAARDIFLEGNKLFNIPLFTQAAEKYIAATAKWKHPAFYFNLAIAQLNLGQEVEAHENLKRATQQGAEPLGTEHYQEAQKLLQGLEQQLGQLRITCPTPGAEITMDGETIFTGPGSYEGWVKASAHEITAKKPTFVPQARRVSVSSGKLAVFDLQLRKLVEGRPWATWKPWAVVGVGAAIAAISGGVHAFSSRNFNAYDKAFLDLPCANSGGCTDQQIRPDLNAQLSRAKQEQKIAIGGYIAGGAIAAAGAVLLYLNRPHLLEQGTADSPSINVAVVPTISVDMLGVLVTVSH